MGNNVTISSGSVVANTGSNTTIDSYSTNLIRSAKYELQMTSGTNYQVTEVRIVSDGNNAWLTQYGDISTNGSLGTVSANVASGIVSLTVNPVNNNTLVRFKRDAINIFIPPPPPTFSVN